MRRRTQRRLWTILGMMILVFCLGTGLVLAAGRPAITSAASENSMSSSSAQSILAAERSMMEVIPEPHTMVLFGTALMGVALVIRRRASH